MPQPFKGDKFPIFGPGKILERPELAAQIAHIIVQWAALEESLTLIYGQVLRALISKNRQSHQVTDTLSSQVFESIFTVELKLRLISKALHLLDETLDSPRFFEPFQKLSKEIRERAKERNNLAHSLWGTAEAYPKALIGGLLVYQLRDFLDISTRVQTLASKVWSFLNELPDSRQSLPRNHKSKRH